MKLEKIHLENFKTFKEMTIKDLPALCVFVGANGAGKSTLFDVFSFLKDCLESNVGKALRQRGDFREVVSRGEHERNICIEIQYRTEITKRKRLVTYHLEIGREQGKVCVVEEFLRYKRGSSGSPYYFFRFSKGKGAAVTNEEDFSKTDEKLNRETQDLGSSEILALKGLGQFEKFKAANELRAFIENWHVSNFHVEASRGLKDAAMYAEHLSETGDNLQAVAKNIHENHSEIFAAIVRKMQRRVPGVSGIETKDTEDGRLLLKFRNGDFRDPFIDRYVSDGTMKMFAYLVLLHDPAPHQFLCIEEPENQLYPTLLHELAEEFRDYAQRGGQVFVSTHSPDFLNAVELDEVFWLEKENGFTVVKRARDDQQIAAYMADGDQMGSLWKQGLMGKVDPR